MIFKDHDFKIIKGTHISEKSSFVTEKTNTLIIKVLKKATKIDIKKAIKKIFNIKVKHVNTLIVKGKKKKNKRYNYKRSNWKKAYIILEKNQKIDFNINKNL
ncbi:50S ribosomal protein L23 [Enterobacteriaceae endosymbiont of Donacia bicoloricornis]|uniref:50S ribosomal protein L23 n=1 Tax=Enterobacteriaceae endosymbiont of Donacia bicoloricornis TaxID=2675772 RepID=UPI0014499980|nr:50S ribosomal protein L23 [Enterobacteriaceae endosymbiont of Donacia bicoloricornis]QJC37794.1 50S ribosomal protein L23 [Enterobacteriaceae endosymbiont of Donacia bicoloricornis]